MKFAKLENHLSSPRLYRYLISASGNKRKTIAAYKLNLDLAQSFHPLLGFLEVVLRNNINNALSKFWNDSDWITNQKRGFMSSSTLQRTNFFLKREVEKAEQRLRTHQTSITSGKIIAEQSFGFWTALFETHHYRLIGGRPIKIFKNLPTGIGRKEVLEKLVKIRRFRNRINHNEPICFVGNTLNFDEAEKIKTSITQIQSWIDIELPTFLKTPRDIQKLIVKGRKI
jgi:hypothetical protein